MPHTERPRHPDLLVLAQEEWGIVERRNQLLVRALSARNPGMRILFVEQALRPRQLRTWRPGGPRRVAPNVWAFRPARPVPDSASQTTADRAEAWQIRRAVRQVGLIGPLAWTQDPHAADLIDRLETSGLIYDLTDDWAAFERDPGRRAAVSTRIDRLLARAELVLACSRRLQDDAVARGASPHYLPNAVDPPAQPAPEPAALAALPHPRIGYAGTLHSDRLDVEMLAAAAASRPEWSFVMLGPDLLTAADRTRLREQPNVVMLGVCPHGEVRAHLEAMDVGLLPNRVTDFTRSLDPLKLYEYLAAGLPIVATPAGIAPELAPFVTVAQSSGELVDAIASALRADDPAAADARRRVVAEETWDSRAGAIEHALGVVPGQRARTDEVSVVVVSFNTKEMLERCLTCLFAQAGRRLQVIVVDNASNDGSPDLVRDRFPAVELIAEPRNLGFGAANNVAFSRCRGTSVLLLNSDAFLHPGAVEVLAGVLDADPGIGACGPRLLNSDGSLQRSAWPFPAPGRIALESVGAHRLLRRTPLLEDLGSWEHDAPRDVDFLIGACLLLRGSALDEIGGFDETFWIYGEEADLQRRLRSRGWRVAFTPEAACTHVGGASQMESTARLRHFYTGQMLFLRKHGRPLAWPVARLALFVGSVLRRRWGAAWVALTLSGNAA